MNDSDLFESMSPARAYFRLSLPLVLGMTVTLIYNLADTYFVAGTGSTAIVAGVSLGEPVFTFLMALGNIGGQGGSSLISRLLGQKKTREAGRVSAFCFYATLVAGVVVGALMLLAGKPMVRLLGAEGETFEPAMEYYTWLSAGAPFILLSFIHSNLLRSEGMSKESMIGTILGALVNIVLDPVFISGLGLGAAGAAMTSDLGYICTVVYDLIIVVRKSHVLSVKPADVRISAEDRKQILAVGTPAALVNILQSASAVLLNQSLLPYGSEKIAAMGIALKVNMIAALVLTGFAYGGQPLFGYYYGAGDTKRFHQLITFSARFIGALAAALALMEIALATPLVRFFMDQGNIVTDGALMLRLQAATMPLMGLILLVMIIFQSTGKALYSFLLSLSRQGVVYMSVLSVLGALAGYTGVIAAQAVSDIISMGIALVLAGKSGLFRKAGKIQG